MAIKKDVRKKGKNKAKRQTAYMHETKSGTDTWTAKKKKRKEK